MLAVALVIFYTFLKAYFAFLLNSRSGHMKIFFSAPDFLLNNFSEIGFLSYLNQLYNYNYYKREYKF